MSAWTREDYVNGLRELASFLERNPDVPLHTFSQMTFRYAVLEPDDAAGMARLAEIAKTLGTEVVTKGDYNDADRTFGPVMYQAGYITQERQRKYEEHMKPYHASGVDG